MLKALHIRNLAVVESARVEFAPGLNLLTGETGSGKSILVDGLGLAFGARSSSDVVRTGAGAACVEAVFEYEGFDEIAGLLSSRGLSVEDELLLRREILANGKSRSFLNDQPVTLGLLKELRHYLLEIHGQGDQHSLLDPQSHVDLLDDFGNLASLRERVTAASERVADSRRALEATNKDQTARTRELDHLRSDVEQIERIKPSPGEDDLLKAERLVLANREKLCALAAEAFERLFDDERSAIAQLARVSRALEEVSSIDAQFAEHLPTLDSIKYQLEDLASSLRDYPGSVLFQPGRLQEVEDRLVALDQLKRRYGPTLEQVCENLDKYQARIAQLTSMENSLGALEQNVLAADSEYLLEAGKLSSKRKQAAISLQQLVAAELKKLAMERCRFELVLDKLTSQAGRPVCSARGFDRAEIRLSPNPGEAPRPLHAVASGGELSRIMLAIKTVCGTRRYPRSLVFDEIDSGIGGRVSEVVGRRLKKLSEANQVLCVTHQAQIARFADAHYVVRKEMSKDRTRTEVARLKGRARVEELARMLGGATITDITRKHASELLEQ